MGWVLPPSGSLSFKRQKYFVEKAMVNHRLVRQAFRKQLDTVSSLPEDSKRAWENRKFSPPADWSMWIREHLMPAREWLAGNRTLELTGIMQYDVCIGAGHGTEKSEDVAVAIGNAFTPGTRLTSEESIQIAIDRAERLPGIVDRDGWYIVPVQIRFRAYTRTQV